MRTLLYVAAGASILFVAMKFRPSLVRELRLKFM
jgi:hypothetical protein